MQIKLDQKWMRHNMEWKSYCNGNNNLKLNVTKNNPLTIEKKLNCLPFFLRNNLML